MSSGLGRSLRVAFVLPLLAIACASPEAGNAPEENLGVAESALELQLDPCSTQSADVSVAPSNNTLQSESIRTSDDAAYAYRSGCKRFVVDTSISVGAVTQFDGVGLTGSAYDLPSSSALGGRMPANALDCGQLRMYIDTYAKDYGAGVFTKIQSTSFGGKWIVDDGPAHCSYNRLTGPFGSSDEYIAAPAVNTTRIYRTAVKVVLRGTAQQAAVRINGYVEPAK
jgi:hypothetical protein